MMDRRLWKIGDEIVDLSRRGMIMGVLNVTPDSFSDGGKFFDADAAVAHGLEMAAAGADIIDIGGESTRPGAEAIDAKEELRRVIPVIEKLSAAMNATKNAGPARNASHSDASGRRIPNVEHRMKFISIDTSKSEVAARALDAGASIINDVTGGRGDPEILLLAAKRKAGLIIMHMQGEPRTMQAAPHYEDVVTEVADFFLQQYDRALDCGIDPMGMAFDPGIGFGKTLAHNIELLKNLERLRISDHPIAVGVSRKSFLGKLTATAEMNERLTPTVALTALLRAQGADVIRVHDVKENVAALRIAEAMLS